MAPYNKFNQTVKDMIDGVLDFDGHTFKVALTTAVPTASNVGLSALTQVANGNGYTTGGTVTTISTSLSGGTAKVTGTDVVFTATGAISNIRCAVLYDDTVTSPTADPLIAWWDYGSAVSLASSETFTVDFDGTNGIFTLA